MVANEDKLILRASLENVKCFFSAFENFSTASSGGEIWKSQNGVLANGGFRVAPAARWRRRKGAKGPSGEPSSSPKFPSVSALCETGHAKRSCEAKKAGKRRQDGDWPGLKKKKRFQRFRFPANALAFLRLASCGLVWAIGEESALKILVLGAFRRYRGGGA